MIRTPHCRRLRCLLPIVAAVLVQGARARDDDERLPVAPADSPYRQECGACHIAYPPGLLPATSWKRLMGDLPHHFGVDASLDAAATRSIAEWLVAHAAPGGVGLEAPPDNRITRTGAFAHWHHELPAATWKRPSVGSASNCSACHAGADQGDFDEHHVHIPR